MVTVTIILKWRVANGTFTRARTHACNFSLVRLINLSYLSLISLFKKRKKNQAHVSTQNNVYRNKKCIYIFDLRLLQKKKESRNRQSSSWVFVRSEDPQFLPNFVERSERLLELKLHPDLVELLSLKILEKSYFLVPIQEESSTLSLKIKIINAFFTDLSVILIVKYLIEKYALTGTTRWLRETRLYVSILSVKSPKSVTSYQPIESNVCNAIGNIVGVINILLLLFFLLFFYVDFIISNRLRYNIRVRLFLKICSSYKNDIR